ncbi:nitroreductase family protein [Gemmiger formicilis]|uniref:nitroreductase family protein n=1 Tax=Gemmiger formicilis TaxID=745368 RepID=UPI003522AF87
MSIQNEILNAIASRRSCRAYKPEQITAEELEAVTTAVLVLGEKNNPNGVQDASLVMGNLLLAASGIGLGSCWINRAKETFETPEGKALLAKWGLDPEKYIGVGYCILGYPAPNGTRTPGPRKAGYVLHV